MKTNKKAAVLYWISGVILLFTSALLIVLYVFAKGFDIQPESMSGFVGTWLSLTVGFAFLPPPIILIGDDTADGEMVKQLYEIGQEMVLFGNAVAWFLWLCAWFFAVCLLLVFREKLMGFDDEDQLPDPLYRRLFNSAKNIRLAVAIFILPNKKGEVPD